MIPVVHIIIIISPLQWTMLTNRLMPVMLDNSDPNKTEKPVYLVVQLLIIVLIRVSVFVLREILITGCFVMVTNDTAVITVCSLLISQKDQ